MAIYELEWIVPTHVVFKKGCLNRIGEYVSGLGARRAVIVTTSGGSMRKYGYLDIISSSLKGKGIEFSVFDKVFTNPTTTLVDELAGFLKDNKADVVIALGGGSAIDAAKAAALVARSGGLSKDYLSGIRVGTDAIPVVAIPTTHGTGSEVDKYAVITDASLNAKLTIVSHLIYPKYAIVDPVVTLTLPVELSSATVFDALSHALESYIGLRINAVSQMFAREALRTIASVLPKIPKEYNDVGVRSALLWASMSAGFAIDQSRSGLMHAIEHVLSAYQPNLHHGLGLAMIAPAWAEFVGTTIPDKVKEIMEIFGFKTNMKGNSGIVFRKFIEYILESLGISGKLSDYGIAKDEVKSLAQDAFKHFKVLINNTPRKVSVDDIVIIIERSL
jgi:alcohol dehydrogenase